MSQDKKFQFCTQMTAADLWKFSMYNANKGHLGIFNALFTIAAVYLLVTQWHDVSIMYAILMSVCALMFTVWQPAILYMKSKKQVKSPAMKDPVNMECTKDGFLISQGELHNEVKWNQVYRVEYIKSEVIIYMDNIHAYLLPERVVGDQKEAFFQMLREVLPKERRKRI